MSNDSSQLGLSPAQERVVAAIVESGLDLGSRSRGRILFVDGQSRSGMSHLLGAAAERLDDLGLRVAVGGLAERRSVELESAWTHGAEALVGSAFSVASALDPALSLMASLAGFSAAAVGVLRAAARAPGEPAELVARALRAAALEESGRPLVCLLDDARWLTGNWWTELQFSFAKEIAEELPLLLVIAVETTPSLGVTADAGDSASRVTQSLLARGLADLVSLDALTRMELSAWLGRMPREAGKAVVELTGGRTGEVADLWRAWVAYGVLERTEGSWRITDSSGIVNDALTALSVQLESLREDRDRVGDDLLREALAFGAVEGRSFTAAAVAHALDRDRDEVEDLLDEVVAEAPGKGILSPPRTVEIRDPLSDRSRALWRYEFSNGLFWRAAEDRLSDVPASTRAAKMFDAVMDVFGTEMPLIMPSLARLADLTGDSAKAAQYRGLVSGPSNAALAAQGGRLLTADTGDWGATDYRDAAEILGDAALGLAQLGDKQVPMAFAQRGADYALTAGEIGNRARAFALTTEGFLLARGGELDLAEGRLKVAREIVRDGAPGLLASILRQLAEVARDRPESFGKQTKLLDEALRLYRRVGDRTGEAAVKYNLAGIAGREGDLPRARILNEEALGTMRAYWERDQEMSCLLQQANIEEKEGNFDLARERIQEVLRYRIAAGHEAEQADCLCRLSRVQLEAGNPGEARDLAKAALAVHRDLESADTRTEVRILNALFHAALALDEIETAKELLQEVKSIVEERGDIDELAKIEAKLEDPKVARSGRG